MSDQTFFKDLNLLDKDSKHIESIDRLQKAFIEVRQKYRHEYNDSMNHVLENIKKKMKSNSGMVNAVDSYVQEYVCPDKREDAINSLYDLLAAEMLHTIQTLQHASCVVM